MKSNTHSGFPPIHFLSIFSLKSVCIIGLFSFYILNISGMLHITVDIH